MSVYQLGLYEKAMPSELDWTDVKRQELARAIRVTGVPIRSMCLSGHRKYPLGSHDPAVRTRSLEMMDKAIELCDNLGIRIIQLAGYDVYYEDSDASTRQHFAGNLAACVEKAAAKGILLGFETMETPFMDTVDKAMAYVQKINSPYLGVYPDLGNLKNAALLYCGDVNDDLEIGRGHIIAAHLKETIPGHYREIPYGTGHTEYGPNLAVLRDIGVRLFVGEFWYKGSEQWREDIQFANLFLRSKLDMAFGQKEV